MSEQEHKQVPAPLAGEKPASAAPRDTDPPEDARALVVDDDPGVCRSVGRVLTRRGFEIVTAADGEAAVAALARGPFDVVVSDINMPGMDGIALLRAVRERDADLPVILITGEPSLDTAMRAVEHGAYQYVPKPFDTEKLARTASEAARLCRLARLKREALGVTGGNSAGAGDRTGLEAGFERALRGLWMAYQPVVRVQDRTVFGYEALMRSSEPMLPHPGAVLDAAERLGRLVELGRLTRWLAVEPMLPEPGRGALFVNLHPRDLHDPELAAEGTPLAAMAARVVLEITERAELGSVEEIRGTVARLREQGFRIAIDDLGAGYAGLTSFAVLRPEIVKIDMSLVRGVDSDPVKQKIIRSMTRMCHEMGMLVVCEGIETPAERDALAELGSDLMQGFLFARPCRPFPEVSW